MKMCRSIPLILVAIFSCTISFSKSDKELRTLFLGNSYIFVNEVDKMYANIVDASNLFESNHTLRITPGGYRLAQHASDAKKEGSDLNEALIDQKGWNYVVLQGQSQTPGLAPANQQTASQDGAVLLSKMAKEAGASVVLYMTWARRDARGTNSTDKAAFHAVQNSLASGYEEMAKRIRQSDVEVKVAPVGRGFEAALTIYGTDFLRSLYTVDGSHPSELGAYLAACIIFSTINDVDPIEIKWAPKSLTTKQSSKIKSSAKIAIDLYKKQSKQNDYSGSTILASSSQ